MAVGERSVSQLARIVRWSMVMCNSAVPELVVRGLRGDEHIQQPHLLLEPVARMWPDGF